MPSIRNMKPIRWLCLGTGAILLLGVATALFLLPRLINKEMVREKIVHLLSQKIAGTITFQDADISLFPIPRVIIRGAGLTIPGKVSGTVRTVTVFPELRPLFSGQVRLSKIQIEEPSFTISIPAKKDDKTESLEEMAALLRSLALGSADVRLSIDNGNITLEKPARPSVSVKEIGLSLRLADTKDEVSLTLDRLSSKDPGLFLSGEFRVSPSADMVSLGARAKGLDVSSVRAAALGLAGDIPIVQKIFDILRSGTVQQISFESRGSALADLGRTANMKIKGRLNKGGVMISGLDLGFREVSGDCDITEGILQGSGLKGEIMHSRISDGKLRIGLKGRDALFQADAAVSADLTDVHAILRRVVKNPEFYQELGHIQAIGGNAEGRLILGESLASVRAKVDIAKMKFTAEYNRVPLPIAVAQGSFFYDEKGVAVKNLAGTIGASAFSGLSARMQTGSSYLEILSGKAGIDAAELHRWLSSYEKLKASLSKITSLSGRLNVFSITFQGPVMDSQNWDFKLSGSAEKLLINTSLLPDALTLNSGRFETQAGLLMLADAGTSFLDASTVLSASLNSSLESVRRGDIRLSGTVGPKALQWIKSTFSIPEYVRTDQTVAVSGARLTWQDKGATIFEGSMKTGSGQSVELDLSKGSDGLKIRKLDVTDNASKASFSLDLQEKGKQFSFKGRLDTSTAAGLITTPQIKGGMVQGEISAGFSEGGAAGITAQGRLRGEKIVLPWKKDLLLSLDSVDMSAEKGILVLNSVHLRMAENDFILKGTAASKADGIVLDMDISTDRLVWESVRKAFEKEGSPDGRQAEGRSKDMQVSGQLRLKAGSFLYDKLTITSLQADIEFMPDVISASLKKAGYCNMDVSGSITLNRKDLAIDLRPFAKELDLGPAIACITEKHADISGSFDLDGRIMLKGRDGIDQRSLAGNLDFTAKDGRISRFTALAKIFALLNVTEIFRGRFPDLLHEGFKYDSFRISGEIKTGKLALKEALIDAPSMELAGEGQIDLIDATTDMKVLVAPFRTVDAVIRLIPWWKDSSLVTIPVAVTGSLKDPQVTYIPFAGVGSGLTRFLEKILKAPVKIMEPLPPGEKK